jgi:hypothetical protein
MSKFSESGFWGSKKNVLKIECSETLTHNLLRLFDSLEVRNEDEAAELLMYAALWCLDKLDKGSEVGALNNNGTYTTFSKDEIGKIKEDYSYLHKDKKPFDPKQYLGDEDGE